MEDLKKKYSEERMVEREEPEFMEEKEMASLRDVNTQDVLNSYEKKHRKDMEDLMRFIKG